jgi:hypothetical protein
MGKDEPKNPLLQYEMLGPRIDDEINLIDLWIELTRFKKVFAAVFVLVLGLGMLYLTLIYKEKFSYTSMLQIGSAQVGEQIVALESGEALRGKLVNVLVPMATDKWLEKSTEVNPFETRVELVKNSDVVMIQNKAVLAEGDFFIAFQQYLANLVLEDHQARAQSYQSGVLSALNTAKIRLATLQNPKYQNMRLELVDQEITAKKQRLNSLPARAQEDLLDDSEVIRNLEMLKLELMEQHADELAQQQAIIKDLERALQDSNHTRVVSAPVRSLGPVNLSRLKLAVALVFVAGVLAFFAMVLASFNEKIRQRRVELAQ